MTHDNHGWDDDAETIVNFTPKPGRARTSAAPVGPVGPEANDSATAPPDAPDWLIASEYRGILLTPTLTETGTPPASGLYGAGSSPAGPYSFDLPAPEAQDESKGRDDPYLAGAAVQEGHSPIAPYEDPPTGRVFAADPGTSTDAPSLYSALGRTPLVAGNAEADRPPAGPPEVPPLPDRSPTLEPPRPAVGAVGMDPAPVITDRQWALPEELTDLPDEAPHSTIGPDVERPGTFDRLSTADIDPPTIMDVPLAALRAMESEDHGYGGLHDAYRALNLPGSEEAGAPISLDERSVGSDPVTPGTRSDTAGSKEFESPEDTISTADTTPESAPTSIEDVASNTGVASIAVAATPTDAASTGDTAATTVAEHAAGAVSATEARTTSDALSTMDAPSATDAPSMPDAASHVDAAPAGPQQGRSSSAAATDTVQPLSMVRPASAWSAPEPSPSPGNPEIDLPAGNAYADLHGESEIAASDTGFESRPDSEMERTNVHLPLRPADIVADLAWLAIVKSPSAHIHQIYHLDSTRMEIGRAFDAPIYINDKTVSTRHAAIRYEQVNDQSEFVLYDLASTNGSYLNGELTHLAVLRDNDRIRLGETELVFKKVGDPSAAEQ